jgi:hypothetical protein
MRWDHPSKMRLLLVLSCCCVLLTGCGDTNTACTLTESYSVSPSTATVDHSATAPGNQQQFTASVTATPPAGCTTKPWTDRAYATWTNPDPLDITISNAADATNGLATCNSATSGPVTLTATTGSNNDFVSATAQLTCQ